MWSQIRQDHIVKHISNFSVGWKKECDFPKYWKLFSLVIRRISLWLWRKPIRLQHLVQRVGSVPHSFGGLWIGHFNLQLKQVLFNNIILNHCFIYLSSIVWSTNINYKHIFNKFIYIIITYSSYISLTIFYYFQISLLHNMKSLLQLSLYLSSIVWVQHIDYLICNTFSL